MVRPDWPAPARVRALVTTRDLGDMASEQGRRELRKHLPAEPHWLRQVHGTAVAFPPQAKEFPVADAAVVRTAGTVGAVMVADCMPVFFVDERATTVAVAHAGWRGLAAGVLEATLDAMGASSGQVLAWLGPAIGARVYEVGEDVHEALAGHETAFVSNRLGHWLLDLYALAREKLERHGVRRIYGGGFCTYSDAGRFFSYRRSRTGARMAAVIWLT